jgi:hypothetical protein
MSAVILSQYPKKAITPVIKTNSTHIFFSDLTANNMDSLYG